MKLTDEMVESTVNVLLDNVYLYKPSLSESYDLHDAIRISRNVGRDVLEAAFKVVSEPSGDVRERIIDAIAGGTVSVPTGCGNLQRDDAGNIADAVLAEFPGLGRDIAAEIEAKAQASVIDDGFYSTPYINGLLDAAEIARAGR